MAVYETDNEKSHIEHVEQLSDDEKVEPTNLNRGMRIDGDDEDHMHEPPVRRIISILDLTILLMSIR